MVEFVTSEKLGRRPTSSGASRIQGYRAGIAQDAAADAAAKLRQTGRSLEQFGANISEDERKKAERESKINDSLLEAQIKSKLMQVGVQKGESFSTRDDYDKWNDEYINDAEASIAPLLAGLSPESRPFIDVMKDDIIFKASSQFNGLALEKKKDSAVASYLQNADLNAKYTMMTGDLSGYESSMQELNSLAAKGYIDKTSYVNKAREADNLFADAQFESMTMRQKIEAVRSASMVGGQDMNYLSKTAYLESRGDALAFNESTRAEGLFQFIPSTAKQYGLNNPSDPNESMKAMIAFTNDNKSVLEKNLGRTPTNAELYLAHQQGATGASKLLKNPDALARDLVGEDAVKLNGGSPNMTAKEFSDMWIDKYNKAGLAEIPNVSGSSGTLLDKLSYDKIVAKRKELSSLLKPDIDRKINNMVAELESTGRTSVDIDEDEVLFAYGNDAPRVLEEISYAKDFGVAVNQTKTMSLQDHSAMISSMTPEGESFISESRKKNAVIAAYEQKEKQLKNDPYSYVLSNFDDAREASRVYEYEQTPESLQQLISVNLDKQKELGVADSLRMAMPPDQAQSLIVELNNMDAASKVEQARNWREMYGEYWPDVEADLIDAGMSNNMSVMLQMDRKEQIRAATLLAEADAVGVDLKKSIPTEDLTGLTNAVYSHLQDHIATLSLQPGGDVEINKYFEATNTLAMKYILMGEAKSTSEAAKKAVKDIVGVKYNYIDNVRVPVEYDKSKIENGLYEFRQSLSNNKDILPLIYDPQSGLPKADAEDIYRKELVKNAKFYTNPANDGVYVLDSLNENVVVAVRGDSGVYTGEIAPLEIKFDDPLFVNNKGSYLGERLSPLKSMVPPFVSGE